MKRLLLSTFLLGFAINQTSFAANYKLPVYVIRTANTDGSETATADETGMKDLLEEANKVWAGSGIEFTFSGIDTNVYKNDLLNKEFSIVPGQDLSNKEVEPKVDGTQYELTRDLLAKKHLGKIVVFASRGSELFFDEGKGKWIDRPRNGWGWGTHIANYIAFPSVGAGKGSRFFAHEVGHYLHLDHTFGPGLKSKDEFQAFIKKAFKEWGIPKDNMLSLFDADAPYIVDTKPDPGFSLFQAINGNGCAPGSNSISIDVTFDDGDTKTYLFDAPRNNVMSYFKHCDQLKMSVSPGQTARALRAIEQGNRRHLKGSEWIPPAPAISSWGPKRLDIFVTGNTASISHKAYDNGKIWPSDTTSQWEDLGQNYVVLGRPATVSWAGNKVATYFRGELGGINHRWWNGSAWSNVGSAGGAMSSDPVAIARTANVHELFAVGQDGNLYTRSWSEETGWKGSWLNLGGNGQLQGNPSIVSWSESHMDVVVRATSGRILRKAWTNGTWYPQGTAFQDLGGVAAGSPSMTASASGRLDLVVRGADNQIYYKTFSQGKWLPSELGWNSLGGMATDSPVIVTPSTNQFHIFTRGANGQVYDKRWTGREWIPAGAEWHGLSGATIGTPAVQVRDTGVIDVVVRGVDTSIWMKTFTNNVWIPSQSGWTNLGKNIR